MSISLTEDVYSINDLRETPEKLLDQARETGRPVVITMDGRSQGVLVDAESYQHLIQAVNMAKALLPAEADVEHGRVRSADTFFAEFKHERKLSRKAHQDR